MEDPESARVEDFLILAVNYSDRHQNGSIRTELK